MTLRRVCVSGPSSTPAIHATQTALHADMDWIWDRAGAQRKVYGPVLEVLNQYTRKAD